ncbi:MAG: DUF5658 family protein [Thermoguttaceae bacterium]
MSHAAKISSATASAAPCGIERRREDRRRRPTSPWAAFWPFGHRMQNRRANDHRRPYFVDRFSSAMFVVVVMLLLATLLDGFLTLRLLEAGADEVNPVMDYLLDYGALPFLAGKYLLTVVGLPLLLIFKNHTLFGTPLRVAHLIPVVVGLYIVLLGYQLVLMHDNALL